MADVTVSCDNCGSSFSRRAAEVNRSRRLGRPQFCTQACAATHRNTIHGRTGPKPVRRSCRRCGKTFQTTTARRTATHCSRSCASAASVTPKRREGAARGGHAAKGNLITPAETLKRREAPRYAKISAYLRQKGVRHEHEFSLGGSVFDLALLDMKILVEFDARYHNAAAQRATDAEKTALAAKHGYSIVRVASGTETVFPVRLVRDIIETT